MKSKKMAWEYTETEMEAMRGQRVVEISDGIITYYAVLDRPQTEAVSDFLSTYQFNDDETPREQLEDDLMETISIAVYPDFRNDDTALVAL
jgi:hypothetical protein